MTRVSVAWLAHFYTSLGFVCAALMAVLIVRGDDEAFRLVFGLMMVATAIDATDGWLARALRVRDRLPHFDGAALDNIIDFHTYTSLPLLLLWRAGSLPGELGWLLLLPLLASAYGFSQVNAKTEDGFFLGFPSYWNIVALYVYMLQMPAWLAASVIILFSLLTFVPTRYLYASRGGPFALVINAGAAVYFVALVVVLLRPAGDQVWLVTSSLAYPLLYLALSAWVTRRHGQSG